LGHSREIPVVGFSIGTLQSADFADDTVLVNNKLNRPQELITAAEQEASKMGLRINSDKCRFMVSGDWESGI